jgi:hypothetical protein
MRGCPSSWLSVNSEYILKNLQKHQKGALKDFCIQRNNPPTSLRGRDFYPPTPPRGSYNESQYLPPFRGAGGQKTKKGRRIKEDTERLILN